MAVCAKCGKFSDAGSTACAVCGEPFPDAIPVLCPGCKGKNKPSSEACAWCGVVLRAPVVDGKPTASRPSPAMAAAGDELESLRQWMKTPDDAKTPTAFRLATLVMPVIAVAAFLYGLGAAELTPGLIFARIVEVVLGLVGLMLLLSDLRLAGYSRRRSPEGAGAWYVQSLLEHRRRAVLAAAAEHPQGRARCRELESGWGRVRGRARVLGAHELAPGISLVRMSVSAMETTPGAIKLAAPLMLFSFPLALLSILLLSDRSEMVLEKVFVKRGNRWYVADPRPVQTVDAELRRALNFGRR